jgi:hypothetical protein
VVGGNTTTYEQRLDVPRLEDDRLGTSSLVLADMIEKLPSKSIGTGQFVIGASKVRPRVNTTFRRDEKVGIYLQVYNFEQDQTTHKLSGDIQYQVFKNGSTEPIFDFTEDVTKAQMVIEKLLPLQNFAPGNYTLKMKVTDKNRNETLTPTATFTVL